jgi:hypothetical protein
VEKCLKGKSSLCPNLCIRTYRGSGVEEQPELWTTVQWVVIFKFGPLNRRLVGPHSWAGRFGENKNLFPSPVFEPQFHALPDINLVTKLTELFHIWGVNMFSIYFFLCFLSLLVSLHRIPVEARFSAPVQTGPGAHPASYTVGTGSFQGVKLSGRGVDHPPPSSVEVKERVELYLYSPSGSSRPVLGWTLPVTFTRILAPLPHSVSRIALCTRRLSDWDFRQVTCYCTVVTLRHV